MKIKLDSNLAVPLFMQLAAALKEEIARGRWKPGDVLPTVRELSQNYAQASVKTSRRALEVLAKEGWTKPRRRVGSVVMDRGIDARTKGRVLILTKDPCHGYYPMRFLLVLGHRFRKHGYGLVSIRCGERGDAMPIRRVAEVLKERWSFVLVMGNVDEARRVVVESERPFALVGNGAPLSRFSAPLCAGRFEVRCEKAIPGFVSECVRRRISRVVQFKYAAGAFDVAGQLSYAGIATETGFEYVAAAEMIFQGMDADAVKVVKAVRDRHDGLKRNPYSEPECGHNYARSMASWNCLLAWLKMHGGDARNVIWR